MPADELVDIHIPTLKELMDSRDSEGRRVWTNKSLAENADISEKTIARARQTGKATLPTIFALARVLGTTADVLQNRVLPIVKPDVKPERYSRVTIWMDRDYRDVINEDTQVEILALLEGLLGCKDTPRFVSVERGSTVVTLSMTDADILRLLAGMMDRKLYKLRIRRIQLHDHNWILHMLAMLHRKEGIIQWEYDSETLAELIDNKEFDFLRLKTIDCFFCKSYAK